MYHPKMLICTRLALSNARRGLLGCIALPGVERHLPSVVQVAEMSSATTPVSESFRPARGSHELPQDVYSYKRLPAEEDKFFTPTTIPKGLLGRHKTAPTAWGQPHVARGKLGFKFLSETETSSPEEDEWIVMNQGEYMVIPPAVPHIVKPMSEDMQMFVRFWKKKEEK